jgi:hypothetical protein
VARRRVQSAFKTGKLAAEVDARTLQLSDIFDPSAVTLPAEYDWDAEFPVITQNSIFLNDQLGCCVISGRAHQTLRFEFLEQGSLIHITDGEVQRQYFAETGGHDRGLVLLHSLKSWRTQGWIAGRRRYRIEAFAEVNRRNRAQIRGAIFLKVGIGIGLSLPSTAIPRFHAGQPWADTSLPGESGHYVFVTGYSSGGLTCVTWGAKQQMSWAYFDKYCDEAYSIIDRLNTLDTSAFDVTGVEDFLDDVDGA